MKPKSFLLSALTCALLLSSVPSASAQHFEITPFIGGQVNGGVDFSTTLFNRIDVQNSLNYGVAVDYLLAEHFGLEFQWNHSNSATNAQPVSGGAGIKVFTLDQNQYIGNFLFHFTNQEHRFRPFAFFGLGATELTAERQGVSGSTRFAFSLGAGAKYNLSRHFGLRGQLKYTPTYLTTTNGGYWCDPFWGGCWVVGNSHYLNTFDMTGGITLRF
jgi:opacity protein-like surface antigen